MKIIKKMIVIGLITASAFSVVGSVSIVNANMTEAATATKTITIEGTKVNVPVKGNKWVNLKGYWHFVKDGSLVKGWRNLNKADGENTTHLSYFDKNGRLYTGWHYMAANEGEKKPHWSYFGENGWLRTGWQAMGTKANPDGKNPRHMSYFGANGWLRTGWVKFGKGTSEPDGNSDVHYSYFGENGWLRTGWQAMGKGTNNPDGNSARHMCYFGNNGWLRTGLQNMGTALNPDGKNEKHKSYFGDNGWLVTNKSISLVVEENLERHVYSADARGWLTFLWIYPYYVKNSDTTVNDKGNVKKYTVKFVSDGRILDVQTVEYGKGATTPTPSREGYVFAGWDKAFDKITADTTVNAKWNAKKYTVKFVSDGKIVKTQTVKYSEEATPPKLTKTGYTFGGWDKSYNRITANTTVNAIWFINNYTVYFEVDGYTKKMSSVEYGKSAIPPDPPSKEGYVFAGWDKTFDKITADTTINAKWNAKKYTVKFVSDGKVIKTQTVEYGKNATPPVPNKTGYTLERWDKSYNGITANTTINAVWKQNEYCVEFVSNGMIYKRQYVKHGKSATAPDLPDREGYTFAGWDKSYNRITANTTVTAKWNVNKYKVKFVSDGKVIKTQTVEYGKSATAPTAPAIEGYTFARWDTPMDYITSDTVITAKYKINYYKTVAGVTFYAASNVFFRNRYSNGKLVEDSDYDKIAWNSTMILSDWDRGFKIVASKDIKKEDLVFKVGGKNNLVLPNYVTDLDGKSAGDYVENECNNDGCYVYYVNGWKNCIGVVYEEKDVLPPEEGGKRTIPQYFACQINQGNITGSFPIEVYYKGELLGKFTIKNTKAETSFREFVDKIEKAAWKEGMTDKEKVYAVADYTRENFTYSEVDCIRGASVVIYTARNLGFNARYCWKYKRNRFSTYAMYIGHNSAVVDFGEEKQIIFDVQGEKDE